MSALPHLDERRPSDKWDKNYSQTPRKNLSSFPSPITALNELPTKTPRELAGTAKHHNEIVERLRLRSKNSRTVFTWLGGAKGGELPFSQFQRTLAEVGYQLSMNEVEALLQPYCELPDRIAYPEFVEFLHSEPLAEAFTPKTPNSPSKRHSFPLQEGAAQALPQEPNRVLLATFKDQPGHRKHLSAFKDALAHLDRAEDGTISKSELENAIHFEYGQDFISSWDADDLCAQYPAQRSGRVDYIELLKAIDETELAPLPSYNESTVPIQTIEHLYEHRTKLKETLDIFRNSPMWVLTYDQLCGELREVGVHLSPRHLRLLLKKQAHQPDKVHMHDFIELIRELPELARDVGVARVRQPKALHLAITTKVAERRKGWSTGGDFHEIFRRCDASNSGLLSFEDFGAKLNEWGVGVTIEQLIELLAPFDANHDGRLTFAEFTQLLNGKIDLEGGVAGDDVDGVVPKLEMTRLQPNGSGPVAPYALTESGPQPSASMEAQVGLLHELEQAAEGSYQRIAQALPRSRDGSINLRPLTDALQVMNRYHADLLQYADVQEALRNLGMNFPDPDEVVTMLMPLDPHRTGRVAIQDLLAVIERNGNEGAQIATVAEQATESLLGQLMYRLEVRTGGSARQAYTFFSPQRKKFAGPSNLTLDDMVKGAVRLDIALTVDDIKSMFRPFLTEQELKEGYVSFGSFLNAYNSGS